MGLRAPSARCSFVPGKGRQARAWSRETRGWEQAAQNWLRAQHEGKKMIGVPRLLHFPALGTRVKRRKGFGHNLLRIEFIWL